MEKYNLICINCPKGCHLEVAKSENEEWQVTGNQCKRGITYAISEMTAPTRVLTTTVRMEKGILRRLPVRTNIAIPKGKLFEAMEIIDRVVVTAPIRIGDVIIKNLLGTGADVIASRSADRIR